jgi:GTP cyclohydrolase I
LSTGAAIGKRKTYKYNETNYSIEMVEVPNNENVVFPGLKIYGHCEHHWPGMLVKMVSLT